MVFRSLKSLFVQSEINKVKERIKEYESIYNESEIKDLTLRRLIITKERELNILETMFKEKVRDE